MADTLILSLPNAIQQTNGQWTKEVEIEEVRTADQDILLHKKRDGKGKGTFEKPGPRRTSEILSRCSIRIGTETRPDGKTRKDLPDFFTPLWAKSFTNDRNFAMIRLRQLSFGDLYRFEANCPACKKLLPRIICQLETLKVKDIPIEVASKEFHETTLPKSKDVVQWAFSTGERDELRSAKVYKEDEDDQASGQIYLHLRTVNGEPVPDGLAYVKYLVGMDSMHLIDQFNQVEGDIDISLENTCNGCGNEFRKAINVMDPGFFFPTAPA